MGNTSRTAAMLRRITCPFCESGKLAPFGVGFARCGSCGMPLVGSMWETLREIAALPDALGGHPCECGHPEMRELPDGVFHCPACGSEVIPVHPKQNRSVSRRMAGGRQKPLASKRCPRKAAKRRPARSEIRSMPAPSTPHSAKSSGSLIIRPARAATRHPATARVRPSLEAPLWRAGVVRPRMFQGEHRRRGHGSRARASTRGSRRRRCR